MKKRLLATLLTAAMVVTAAAGCGSKTANDSGSSSAGNSQAEETEASKGAEADDGEKKVIRIGITSSPSGIFVKMYHNDTYNGYITYSVYESLTQVNPEGETEPRLAKSWDISDDGRTYTFHLNEGITWQDGEPFTANDVAFTYNYMSQPGYNGYDSAYISEIEGYDEVKAGTAETLSGVEVIDENTISITTTNVYSSLLNRIGGRDIVAEHIWGDVDPATGDQQTELIKNPVGTGPFKLKEFVQDQYVTLEANEDYWQGAPQVDEITYITVNTDTAQAQMLNGELDILGLWSLSDDDLAIYEENGLDIEYSLGNSYQAMQVNQEEAQFQPVEIRRALAYAINRQGIVDALLYTHGNVANTIYAESFWAYPGDEQLSIYEYNPQKAIELFESQGYSYDADANVMSDPEGNPVQWRLFVPTGNEAREQSGTVIQSNLGEIGIEIDVETMEFATLVDILSDNSDPNRFDLALTGYGLGADPDVSTLVTTDGASNYSHFSDAELDELVAEVLQTADEEKKAELYTEIAVQISEKLPLVYLYNWQNADAQNPAVHTISNVYWTAYNSYLWTKD